MVRLKLVNVNFKCEYGASFFYETCGVMKNTKNCSYLIGIPVTIILPKPSFLN
jgi:hypothetical protein